MKPLAGDLDSGLHQLRTGAESHAITSHFALPLAVSPDCWRYLVEVQDAGKPADVTGYR